MGINLAVVCPVFNEEQNVATVFQEWVEVLDKIVRKTNYHFIFFNDGSTDNTLSILKKLENSFLQMKVVEKNNTGHGPTCIFAYRYALTHNYQWIFQIDSDGQCDPKYFASFWTQREKNPWQFGHRKSRDDGFVRVLVSKILALVIFLASGIWVKDANVPYRLFPSDKISSFIDLIPENFFLANILFSIFCTKRFNVIWHDIHFRNRFSGQSKVKGLKFAKIGLKLFFDLLKLKKYF